MKSGIVNETNKAYHGDKESISKSRLSNMSVCPQYFKFCEEHPSEPTEDLIFGSAFHKWVLEEDTFYDEFSISPVFDRRFKAQKEQAQAFLEEAEAQGKQIITEAQFDVVKAMKNAIMENKYAKRLLDGEHEKSFYFEDDLTHEKCKARPDCYTVINDHVVITDLKSCRSALTENFMKDVVKYTYDLQAYMYCLAASKVLNVPIENIDFVFVAVEKTEPYLMKIMQADKFVFERGESLFRSYIGTYNHCKETGNWYGLNGEYGIIEELHLPSYLMKEIDK